MKYMGKSHNLWHRMALGLEQMCFDPNAAVKSPNPAACYEFEPDQVPKNVKNQLFCYRNLLNDF